MTNIPIFAMAFYFWPSKCRIWSRIFSRPCIRETFKTNVYSLSYHLLCSVSSNYNIYTYSMYTHTCSSLHLLQIFIIFEDLSIEPMKIGGHLAVSVPL